MAVDTAGNQSEVVTEIYIIGDLVTDTDEDGMPDVWEVAYFGDLSRDGTGDFDGDGLSDLDEYLSGTVPIRVDTDQDGMADGWEVAYGLNPLVDDASEDPDGDGLTNLEEYNLGRHPQNAEPDKPVLSLPTADEPNVLLTPTLKTDDFNDQDGDGHAATEWQISKDASFSPEHVVLGVTSDSFLTSLTVSGLILSVNTTYYWRVRFHDDRNAASGWSAPFQFRTIEASASDDPNSNGIPDNQEIDDPDLDLDENNIPDITQADLKCVNAVVGDGQVDVKQGTNVASIDSLMSIDPAPIADTENKPDEMPIGLISFKLTVDNPGAIAKVTVYLSEPAATDAKWYKYDTINGWQDYSDHAEFSANRRSLTLELQDGGYGDADGVANGIIVDPSGPGTAPAGGGAAPPSGGGGGCFIGEVTF